MEKEEAEDLIETLAGDEHTWVDFKTDYEVGGISTKRPNSLRI